MVHTGRVERAVERRLGHAEVRPAAVRIDELHHDLGLTVVAGAEHGAAR